MPRRNDPNGAGGVGVVVAGGVGVVGVGFAVVDMAVRIVVTVTDVAR